MRRFVIVALASIAGVVIGVTGTRVLTAQDLPVKRTMLIQTDLVGTNGKHANMYVTEAKPGVDLGRHYHLGHTFVYVLEGAILIQETGKPAVTYGPGQAFHEPPQMVHDARSGEAAPLKILVFQAIEKGQPLAVPVK